MGVRKKGGIAAVGFLCAVAATVTVWSGPLASATAAFHASSGTGSAPVVAHAAPSQASK